MGLGLGLAVIRGDTPHLRGVNLRLSLDGHRDRLLRDDDIGTGNTMIGSVIMGMAGRRTTTVIRREIGTAREVTVGNTIGIATSTGTVTGIDVIDVIDATTEQRRHVF
jgi:hypothetical protein